MRSDFWIVIKRDHCNNFKNRRGPEGYPYYGQPRDYPKGDLELKEGN